MKVPLVDLKTQYLQHKEELDQAIYDVIEQTAFVRGPYVKKFEEEFAAAYGVKHCISCANGTDSLYIALKMQGVGSGDEVITVANSWISSSEVISLTGATPVFVDIDEYFTLDVTLLEEKISERTKAIIPVHLYGQAVDMDALMKLAHKYRLFVLEDCAQAHFAKYKEQYVGTLGHAASFSFYPGKNLGAYGDAGCVVTDNDELAEKIRRFSNHGALVKHSHDIEGCNSRMDGIQAAIISVKLKYIHEWNASRHAHAQMYTKLLSGVDEIVVPKERKDCGHVFHVYCLKVERRDELQNYLSSKGISTAIHYPVPLPFMKAYEYLGHQIVDFPRVAIESDMIISLPMYPELCEEQIHYVAATVKDFYTQ